MEYIARHFFEPEQFALRALSTEHFDLQALSTEYFDLLQPNILIFDP